MKKTLFSIFTLLTLGILFVSCTKTVQNNNNDNKALSQTFRLESSEWVRTNDNGIKASLEFKELTSNITDAGLVIAYLSFDGGHNFDIVPTDVDGVHYSFTHGDSNVTLYGYALNGGVTQVPGRLVLKVVSIPARSLTISSTVNMKDYNAVKAAFSLND